MYSSSYVFSTTWSSVLCIEISTFATIVMIEKFHDTENVNSIKGNVAHQEDSAHGPGHDNLFKSTEIYQCQLNNCFHFHLWQLC